MTINELYRKSIEQLTKAGCQSPAFDSMCLIEKNFDLNRAKFLLHSNETANEEIANLFLADIERRCGGEPLQYILGEWEFIGLKFLVGKGVLIPRADTEVLCETVIEHINRRQMSVLDLCSGSGAIAIAIARFCGSAKVTALEKYDEALAYLTKNNELNNADVEIIQGDVLQESCKAIGDRKFDVITCNPPYITAKDMAKLQREVQQEPETALFGGEDGLMFYRKIPELWKSRLNKSGMMIFEIGMGQHDDVSQILLDSDFVNIFFKKDLNGIIRVVGGFLK